MNSLSLQKRFDSSTNLCSTNHKQEQMKTTLLFSVGMFGLVLSSGAQNAGDLDLNFGTSGYAFNDHISNTGEVFADMAVQQDDKLVMVGYTEGANENILIARYLSNGTPDSTFGVNGLLEIDLTLGANERAYGLKVLSDGKILVTGSVFTQPAWEGFVMRVNDDGTVDNSFGDTAPGRTHFSAGDNAVTLGRAIQTIGPDIYVGGSALFSGQGDMCVFKFSQGGGAVTSFASSGVASVDIDGEGDQLYSMTLTSNNSFILAGVSDSAGTERGALVKLNSFGLPTSFAGQGHYTFDLGSGNNQLNDVMVDAAGRIIAVGNEGADPNINGVILRLNDDGTEDTSFSGDGFQGSDPGNTTSMFLTRVFPVGNNGILATGYTSGANKEVYAFQMTETGSPDGSFGTGGDVNHAFPNVLTDISGIAAAIQSDGGVVVGGYLASQDFVGSNGFMLRLSPEDQGNSIEEVSELEVSIYPNPLTQEELTIEGEAIEGAELIGLNGQAIWLQKQSNNKYYVPNHVANGMYILKIHSNKGIGMRRLMLAH